MDVLVWEDWLSFFFQAHSQVVEEAWLSDVNGVVVIDAMSL